jgi:hypothetical protein
MGGLFVDTAVALAGISIVLRLRRRRTPKVWAMALAAAAMTADAVGSAAFHRWWAVGLSLAMAAWWLVSLSILAAMAAKFADLTLQADVLLEKYRGESQ